LRHQSPHSEKSFADEDDVSSIVSVEDERLYWLEKSTNLRDVSLKERSSSFSRALTPMAQDFPRLDKLGFADFSEFLEKAHDVLDDLWKMPASPRYPKARMVHLLNIIGSIVSRKIQTIHHGTENSEIGLSAGIWFAPVSKVL
jgi:hypothetical protein